MEGKTNIRYSKKREAIWNALSNTTCHPTAEWLFQTLKPEYPDLSLGTVYRNLTFFQEQGQIRSVGVVNGQERFDADTSQHGHFYCQTCGRVEDLQNMNIDPMVTAQVEKDHGFTVQRQEVNLYGTCSHCQSKKTPLPS